MKPISKFLFAATCSATVLIAATLSATADSAKVSDVIKDVSISGQQASVGDNLSGSASLKTGSRSRAELTFEDSTLLRVGSNSVFSFLGTKGTAKEFSLTQGTAFVAAPATHGGVNVRCGGVTAAIEGCLVTLGWAPEGLFIGVAHETGEEGGGGVSIGGHEFKSNQAGFIPFGPDGKLDFSRTTFFSFDGAAMLLSGKLTENLPEDLQEIAKRAKIKTFATNQASSSPGTQRDPTFQNIRDIESVAARFNDPPPSSMSDCRKCEYR